MIPIRINGSPVFELSLHMPINGAWSADLHCSDGTPFAVGSVATLTLPDQALKCRVVRSQKYSERIHVRVLGGAIDWQAPVAGINYGKVSADKVLSDMLVITDSPIGAQLDFWTRLEGTIGQSVQLLARHLGFNWRVNPDGSVRLKLEDPQSVLPDAVETYRDESRGMIELAIEKAVVLPGCLVNGDTVGEVIYSLKSDGRLICRYWTEGRGRVLERYVRWVTRDQMYLGTYGCSVSRQAADGSLDLVPDDARLKGAGLQGVSLRHGLPGCVVKVPGGTRVMLAYENGDPTKPYASLWSEGQVTSIELGGTLKVALAQLVTDQLNTLKSAINGGVTVPNDGGASLKATILAALTTWPGNVASEKLSTK